MLQERLVDLREPFEYRLIRRYLFAQTNKSTDYVDTHLYRTIAPQNVRGHQVSMFGKSPRAKPRVPVLLGTGHSL